MIRYYVRVSTMEQKIDRQLVAYSKADFQYIDKMSGRNYKDCWTICRREM